MFPSATTFINPLKTLLDAFQKERHHTEEIKREEKKLKKEAIKDARIQVRSATANGVLV